MNKLITDKQQEVSDLCRQFHVRQLEVFGSVIGDQFDPESSDLDFLVEFDEIGINNYADNYFGLLSAFQELFGLPVDLVVSSTVENPYLLESIEANKHFLYAA